MLVRFILHSWQQIHWNVPHTAPMYLDKLEYLNFLHRHETRDFMLTSSDEFAYRQPYFSYVVGWIHTSQDMSSCGASTRYQVPGTWCFFCKQPLQCLHTLPFSLATNPLACTSHCTNVSGQTCHLASLRESWFFEQPAYVRFRKTWMCLFPIALNILVLFFKLCRTNTWNTQPPDATTPAPWGIG